MGLLMVLKLQEKCDYFFYWAPRSLLKNKNRFFIKLKKTKELKAFKRAFKQIVKIGVRTGQIRFSRI